MHITERKIIDAIEICIKAGETNFFILPYGRWGKKVKDILNNRFKVQERALIDNSNKTELENVVKVKDIDDCEGTILFATTSQKARDELLPQLQRFRKAQILDIALRPDNSPLFFSLNSDKLEIEECNLQQREVIFEKTRMTWERLGEEEPYWSVLTSEEYQVNNMSEENEKKFYGTGYSECIAIIKTLERVGIVDCKKDVSELEITEMGCGTGRVTNSLAEYFGKVNAFDISAGNMQIAKKKILSKNVSFCLIKNMNEYQYLPQVDVVYSMIVLQHNCPPVIEYMLECMFASLRKNGVCIFQVPTYRDNYSFRYLDYINNWEDKMEMHLLPQKKIFEIANKQNCLPIEVYQDSMTGNEDFSTTFVFKKL